MTFIQCWSKVENVEPTLYKCYTNVLCLLGDDKSPECGFHGSLLSAAIAIIMLKYYCVNGKFFLEKYIHDNGLYS